MQEEGNCWSRFVEFMKGEDVEETLLLSEEGRMMSREEVVVVQGEAFVLQRLGAIRGFSEGPALANGFVFCCWVD
jgi:hypothetical protein